MIDDIIYAIKNRKCLIAITQERAMRIEPYAYGMDLEGSQALLFKPKELENGELQQVKLSEIRSIQITECEVVIQDKLANTAAEHFNFVFSSLLKHSS